MKTSAVAALALLCLVTHAAVAQSAANRPFYVGLDVGQSTLDRNHDRLGMSPSSVHDTAASYRLRFGYRFSRHLSLEAGLSYQGEFSGEINYFCAAVVGVECPAVDVTTTARGVSAIAVGTLPLREHFYLSASGGLLLRELKSQYVMGSSISDSHTLIQIGVGMGFPVNERLELGLDWTHSREVGLGYASSEAKMLNRGESSVASFGIRFKL